MSVRSAESHEGSLSSLSTGSGLVTVEVLRFEGIVLSAMERLPCGNEREVAVQDFTTASVSFAKTSGTTGTALSHNALNLRVYYINMDTHKRL